MIKKRINTDLFLSLAIKDAQGADVDMSAATGIEVYVRSQKSLKRVTHAFAISANVVSLQYSAEENHEYGKHNVTVEWNDPDARSKTGIIHKAVDFVSAFEIVASTAMEENVEVTLNGVVYTFGAPGKSAYECAVQNGFSGTVQEWLASLKGLQGDKGDKGDAGIQGIQGEQGEKGDKGDAFTFADFTSEQIVELQKPATDAAVAANSTLNMLSSTLSEEEFVMSASASILCGWWNVASPPQATAEQQYWWDGASMHVSVAVLDTKGVITGYTWNPLALSDTAVYIDSSTSAVYKYKNGVMVSFSNITAVIALQLHGINEVLTKINAEV